MLPFNAALKRYKVMAFCLFDMPFLLNFFFSLCCSST